MDETKQHDFEEVARIDDPDGIVAVITSRVKFNGRKSYSYMFAKVYDKNGEVHQTVWLGPQHLEAVRRLIDRVDRQIELFEDRDRAAARLAAKKQPIVEILNEDPKAFWETEDE